MARNKKMYGEYAKEPDRTTVIAVTPPYREVRRKCIFCGEWKPIEEFPKNGRDENGEQVYRDDCKVCYNIRRKANTSANKKKHSDFVNGQKRRGESTPQLTHQEWKECLIFFQGECAYCGCTARKGKALTKDHLRPVNPANPSIEKGKTVQSNIVPACSSCNSSKGNKDFKDWFMAQPFFSQERMNRIFKWRHIIKQAEGSD